MKDIQSVVLMCNLKSILNEKNISANKLANEINERRSTINDLINNNSMSKRQIPARMIAKICFYLNVSPSELFTVITSEDDE